MNALARKKSVWENYHERQLNVIARRSQDAFIQSLQGAAVILSLLLFLIYKMSWLWLMLLKLLFIGPRLVRRIDPHRVEEISNLSPTRLGPWL